MISVVDAIVIVVTFRPRRRPVFGARTFEIQINKFVVVVLLETIHSVVAFPPPPSELRGEREHNEQ